MLIILYNELKKKQQMYGTVAVGSFQNKKKLVEQVSESIAHCTVTMYCFIANEKR